VPRTSQAIELLDTSIVDYLKKHCPGDDGEVAGVSQEGLDAFASSMAGYAVLTYILAVGDRHLGNLLVLPNGKMCHIDFGFVFGDDPKKKFVNPPPFRITKGMVDAMGGQKGECFQQVFCRRAFGAYKELRHNAVLVMSLLRLMKDSGIEALEENREAKLQTVEDRFRLDLNDEDAEAFMAGVIQESMTHVGIQVLEGFHNIARILR
jgi:phosphatidylinositol 3-kinase